MAKQIGNTDLIDTWASEGNIVDPDLSKKEEGWLLGEQPPHEWMNHIQNEHGQKINRLLDDTYNEEAGLNRRVIYVDTVADLQALDTSGLVEGQAASVQGSEFRWGGSEWHPVGVVSVKAFGARGDGDADDTSSIQSAINSGAKTVYIPPGDYKVMAEWPDTALTVSFDNFRVYGEGRIVVGGKTRRLIEVFGDDARITLNIDGQDMLATAVRVFESDRALVENCKIENLYSDDSSSSAIEGWNIQGGFIARNNVIRKVKSEGGNGFARAVLFHSRLPVEKESIISDNFIEDILGIEGDPIAIQGSDGEGGRVHCNVYIYNNTIRNFSRRAIKVQGYGIRIIGNYCRHDFESAEDLPNAQNVIDLVQGKECYIINNVLENCKFMTQISALYDVGDVFDDIVVRGNVIKGVGSETENICMIFSTSGRGLEISGNNIKWGTGRVIGIGNSVGAVVSGNIIDAAENNDEVVINTTSAVQKCIIKDNYYFGESRQAFALINTSNLVLTNNHIKSEGTPLHRSDTSFSNALIQDNSVDGGGFFSGSLRRGRNGGNYYFGDDAINTPAPLVATSLSHMDDIIVRSGQVVINVGTSGPLAWRATQDGLGSEVSWDSLGS